MKYVITGVRRNDLPSENAYWDLIRNYSGVGEFIPFEEGGYEGNFKIFINSGRLGLDELRKHFPSLEIHNLEERAA